MVDIGAVNGNLTGNRLLSLFGTSLPSSQPTMTATVGFSIYVQNENDHLAKYAQQASVKQAVDYFKSHISKVKSVADLTKDPKLLNFVLTAFGLQADAHEPALIAGVLNSDLSKGNSLANMLADPRFQQLAKEFNVHTFGMANFSSSQVIDDVVTRYLTNAYEVSLDDVNSALHSAAYFLRNIGNVTSAYNILADPVLRNVVLTVTGLPAQIANLPIQDEANLISSKVDLKAFATGSSSSGASGSSSSATTALSLYQSNLSALSSATAVATAAQTSVQSIVDQINAITQAQQNLSNIQSGTGPFASEIPVQEAAAPVLIEQQGLLAAAQKATGTVTSDIAQLQDLVKQAGDPNNTTAISQLQSEFTTLVNSITSAISGATYQYDNNTGGVTYTSQNLIDGSLGSAITVQYDSAGDTATVNPQNLGAGSSFESALNAAQTAFTSATPDLTTAAAQLTSALTTANNVSSAVSSDATNFASAISSVSAPFSKWAGTYNTASVYLGSQSVVDAGTRLTQINLYVSQLQNIAQTSAQADPGADRSIVQAQYDSVLTKLSDAINNTGTAGLDNLLNGTTTYSYNVIGNYDIQAQGQDLVTNVLNQLNTLDVTSQANAGAVLSALSSSTLQDALTQAGTQIGIDSQYFNIAKTVDPASTIYTQYASLASNVSNLVSQAKSNGTNLLDPNQVLPITVTATAANQSISVTPEATFYADVQQVLSAGAAALLSNTTTAFSDLSSASFSANSILDHLNGELNQLQYATSVTNTAIANLQKKQQASATTVIGQPVHATAYAQQFIKRYLAIVDSQSAAASGMGAGALLPLFANANISGSSSGSLLNILA